MAKKGHTSESSSPWSMNQSASVSILTIAGVKNMVDYSSIKQEAKDPRERKHPFDEAEGIDW